MGCSEHPEETLCRGSESWGSERFGRLDRHTGQLSGKVEQGAQGPSPGLLLMADLMA